MTKLQLSKNNLVTRNNYYVNNQGKLTKATYTLRKYQKADLSKPRKHVQLNSKGKLIETETDV